MDLGALFSALDTSLSLHYLTNTTDPAVHELCASATSLSQKRIEQDAVESILGVDASVWTVWYSAPRDAYCIGPPAGVTPKAFSGSLEQRKAAFRKSLAEQKQAAPVALGDVAAAGRGGSRDASTSSHIRPSRDGKSRAPISRERVSKARAQLTKGTRQFSLKGAGDFSGLSLLERIKLKEKAKKSVQSPEVAYAAYIHDKVAAVYDILYELTRNDKEKTFPFAKVVSIIKDSIFNSISDNEVTDVLQSISTSLPNKVFILKCGDIKGLKVSTLDRDKDLERLAKEDIPSISQTTNQKQSINN